MSELRIPNAKVSKERSEAAICEFAKTTLDQIGREIAFNVARNETKLCTDVDVPIHSPIISLLVAALRKLEYKVQVDESTEGTQVSIDWS